MNFYRNRPLALSISIAMVIFGLSAHINETLRGCLATLVALSVFLIIFISRRHNGFTLCGCPPTRFAVLLGVVVLIGILMSHAFYDNYEKPFRKLGDSAAGGKIKAEILSVESESGYNAVYKIKLHSFEGENSDAVGLAYTESSPGLWAGCVIEATVEFSPMRDFYSYKNQGRTDLLAKGIVFTCNITDRADLLYETNSISLTLANIRSYLGASISQYLKPDSAALAKALFLGERSELGRIYRDFKETGTLHILALSGMHIAVIGSFLERLLFRVRFGKALRFILISLFMVTYAAVTGFSPSVVRSVIMLIISYIANLSMKSCDRITSLFAACFLIILVRPAAVYDIGLQLSFFATLGLLLMSDAAEEKLNKVHYKTKRGILLSNLRKLLISVAASLGAVMFILPLIWLYFGEMSLSFLIATLILSPITAILLSLILPYLLFSLINFKHISSLFAIAIDLLSDITAFITRSLADISVVISLRYPFVLLIIIAFVLTIVIMIIKNVKGWHKALIPFFSAMILLLCGAGIYEAARFNTPVIYYAAEKSHDILIAASAGRTMLIDFTNGSGYAVGATNELLDAGYYTKINSLVMTRITRSHVNALRILLSQTRVDSIFVPMPKEDGEKHLTADLYTVANEYSAKVILYSRNSTENFTMGRLTVTLPEERKIKRSVKPLPAAKFTANGISLSYVGTAAWEDAHLNTLLEGADIIIFGANGPKLKEYDGSIISDKVKVAVAANEELAKTVYPYLNNGVKPISPQNGIRIIMAK